MGSSDIESLRKKLNDINHQILDLISIRGKIVQEIGREKQKQSIQKFDPVRESVMLEDLVSHNEGPFDDTTIRYLFKQIFKASLNLLQEDQKGDLLVTRRRKSEDTIIRVKNRDIGGKRPIIIAGPCMIESYEQMRQVASSLNELGVDVIRGGAFKSRTSPYDFQGLGLEGLKILNRIGNEFNMLTISEIMDASDIETAANYIDIIEIGAKNMQNFSLLKAVGNHTVPVLLKRGMSATLEELLLSAEYIVSNGNNQVILMERGIRTYEKWTSNTLDISAIPILKNESHLPVFVDVSHSIGRKDIIIPCAKAALAAEANGLMVEVHPNPSIALSDARHQLDIQQFIQFHNQLKSSGLL